MIEETIPIELTPGEFLALGLAVAGLRLGHRPEVQAAIFSIHPEVLDYYLTSASCRLAEIEEVIFPDIDLADWGGPSNAYLAEARLRTRARLDQQYEELKARGLIKARGLVE